MHIHVGIVMEVQVTLHAECVRKLVKSLADPALPLGWDFFLNEFSGCVVTVFAGFLIGLVVLFGHFFLIV